MVSFEDLPLILHSFNNLWKYKVLKLMRFQLDETNSPQMCFSQKRGENHPSKQQLLSSEKISLSKAQTTSIPTLKLICYRAPKACHLLKHHRIMPT